MIRFAIIEGDIDSTAATAALIHHVSTLDGPLMIIVDLDAKAQAMKIEASSLDFQPAIIELEEFRYLPEERFESRSGWYIPRSIGRPQTIKKQFSSTRIRIRRSTHSTVRFWWKAKKQKKHR